MYIGQVEHLLFLSHNHEISILSTDFRKIFEYQISWKPDQWEPSCPISKDGWTDRQDEANSRSSRLIKKPYKTHAQIIAHNRNQCCRYNRITHLTLIGLPRQRSRSTETPLYHKDSAHKRQPTHARDAVTTVANCCKLQWKKKSVKYFITWVKRLLGHPVIVLRITVRVMRPTQFFKRKKNCLKLSIVAEVHGYVSLTEHLTLYLEC